MVAHFGNILYLSVLAHVGLYNKLIVLTVKLLHILLSRYNYIKLSTYFLMN